MSKYPPLKYRKFTKRLKELGCEDTGTGRGSHEVWYSPHTDLNFTVPRKNGTKELGKGLINEILKRAGIDKDKFYEI